MLTFQLSRVEKPVSETNLRFPFHTKVYSTSLYDYYSVTQKLCFTPPVSRLYMQTHHAISSCSIRFMLIDILYRLSLSSRCSGSHSTDTVYRKQISVSLSPLSQSVLLIETNCKSRDWLTMTLLLYLRYRVSVFPTIPSSVCLSVRLSFPSLISPWGALPLPFHLHVSSSGGEGRTGAPWLLTPHPGWSWDS